MERQRNSSIRKSLWVVMNFLVHFGTLILFGMAFSKVHALEYCEVPVLKEISHETRSFEPLESNEYDRLPHFAYPIHYNITIHPFYNNFTFTGHTDITVQIVNDTSVLALNAFLLYDLEAEISGDYKPIRNLLEKVKDEQSLPIRWARSDVIEIAVSEILKAGSVCMLSMNYKGNITDDLVGVYRSSYTDRNNLTSYMIATQFESVRARRAFPCWDEPIFKATFEISLYAPSTTTVLSNMPVLSRSPNPDDASEVLVKFRSTLKMSTYLIAFVIGDLDYVEGEDSYGTIHRVYTPVYRSNEGLYALNVSIKSIELLSAYFKQLYPLSKLDSVALKDFLAGAMENWGLVTYREARILVGDGTSLSSKFSTANTICHENSHMWFGDLVTMAWWSDLWLNEGFATWSAYRVENIIFPEYDTWNRFLQNDFKSAMAADARETTHKIVVELNNTDEVESIFDSISYDKGASIIRMLEQHVGEQVFRRALQNYMSAYAYMNAYTVQLWDQIAMASGQNISQIMDTWTNQPGFPYVKVLFELHDNMAVVHLEQARFFLSGKSDPDEALWHIPVSICNSECSSISARKFLMTEKSLIVNMSDVDVNSWFKLNAEKTGFYVTMYEKTMLEKLQDAVLNKELGSSDRLDLESDLYMLGTAGFELMSTYLDFLLSYINETDYIVWNDIVSNLFTLNGIMEYMNIDKNLNAFSEKLLANILQYVGMDEQPDEPETMSSLRSTVFRYLGLSENTDVIAKMRSLFQPALNDPSFMPNLRNTILIVNVRNGDVNEYNAVKEAFMRATTSEDEVNLLVSLGYTTNPDCALDLTAFASLSGSVRIQDVFYPLRALGYSKVGRDTIWSYFKANITALQERFASNILIDDYITRCLNGFATTAIIPEMTEFFQQHNISTENLLIKNMMEDIQIRSNVAERSAQDLYQYLNNLES